jgi:hypothetical protein
MYTSICKDITNFAKALDLVIISISTNYLLYFFSRGNPNPNPHTKALCPNLKIFSECVASVVRVEHY